MFDVVATDPAGMSAAIRVTINAMDDDDESPAITGDMTAMVAENAENQDLNIFDYEANDPDADVPDTISWSLSGADARDFEITDQGALSLKESPNYERPADADMDNVYKVTVQAGDSVGNRGDRDVEVTVTNAEEPGTISLSSVQTRVGVPISATLSDPDGGVTNVTWQWNDGSVDIADATSATFTPTADEQGDTLMLTALYTDAQGANKMAVAATTAVAQDTRNKAPVFGDQDPDTDGTQNTTAVTSVPENTMANGTDDPATATDNADDDGDSIADSDNVGDAITATDPNDTDQITYSLSGVDANSFRVRNNGQIEVAAGTSLNYETKRTYSVTLRATDSFGLSASIAVTINVTDLNEGPAVTGPSEMDYAENGTGAAAVFRATDPENAGATAWSLEAGEDAEDAEDFMIDGGTLRFSESPDYETPADADINNIYIVTVVATDADFQSTTKEVTITVTNADEAGKVSLASTVEVNGSAVPLTALAPHPGTMITAALKDEDGRDRNHDWQWSRSTTRSASYINIANAEATTYAPTTNDVGYYLRATVAYDDREGGSKSAMASSVNPVQVIRSPNAAPAFGDEDPDTVGIQNTDAARMVLENAEAGSNVGAAVRAADPNNDILTYALTGGAAARVEINPANGQIMVNAGSNLNFETDDAAITGVVVAVDPAGMFTTIVVSITVQDDSDEPPTISATFNSVDVERVITVMENPTDLAIVTFTAVDPDRDDGANDLTWSLSGDDSGDFTIGDNGELSFNSAPNYESPADADANNVYLVTVQAADPSRNRGEKEIEVRVTNVNENGSVTLSSIQARVGVPITASLSDPDGGVTNVTWQWESNNSAIDGATSATYTPVAANSGQDLQAMASYTDAQGLGKVAESATGLTVAADTRNKPPAFADQDNDTPGTQNTMTEISVPENTKANSADDNVDQDNTDGNSGTADDNVGTEITATDTAGDNLTYTLSGSDAGSFRVRINGQIEVGAGASLDYESKDTYNVTLTATDSFGLTASIAVTITVTDLNEGPVITLGSSTGGLSVSGPRNVSYAENGASAVATYRASGATRWSLEGADAGDFTIGGGVLNFRSSPDFEVPVDANTDNIYMITVRATGGTGTGAIDVTVRVTNVDDTASTDLLESYDANNNGQIDRPEVITGINDYLDNRGITRAQVFELINLYFDS